MNVLGMLRIGERRLVMLTMLQMESRLAKGDDPSLNTKVFDLSVAGSVVCQLSPVACMASLAFSVWLLDFLCSWFNSLELTTTHSLRSDTFL